MDLAISIRRRVRDVVAVACVATLFAACSGTPVRDGLYELGARPESNTIFSVVPADITYAYAIDLTSLDAEMLRAQLSGNQAFALLAEQAEDAIGIDVLTPEGLESLGIDLTGDIAVFSSALAPVFFARLTSEDALRDAVADFRDRNPDIEWRDFELAGASFQAAEAPDFGVDFGVVAGYAVVRFRVRMESLDVTDDTLERTIVGTAGPNILADPRVGALRQRGEGNTLTGITLFDPSRAWARFAASDLRDDLGVYPDAATRAACDVASAATAGMVEWYGSARFSDTTNPNVVSSAMHAQLTSEAADLLRDVLRPAAGGAGTTASEAPLFATAHVDLAALVEAIDGDPELRHCPDLAALGGWLAYGKQEYASQLQQATQTVTGLFALGLFDLDVNGFIPRIDLAIMLGSNDPVTIVEALQGLIEGRGGQGTVDETSPYTAIDYRLLGFEIRITQRPDRVVVRTGDVPVGFENSLAAEPLAGGFSMVQMRGQALATLIDTAVSRLADMGAVPEAELNEIRSSFEAYYWIDRMLGSASLVGDAIVGDVRVDYDATRVTAE